MGRLFLQDSTGVIRISVRGRPEVKAGQIAEVLIRKPRNPEDTSQSSPQAESGDILTVGRSPLPTAEPVAMSLVGPARNSMRVELRGVLQRAEPTANGPELLVAADGVEFSATAVGTAAEPKKLINARVRLSGVLEAPFHDQHWGTKAHLWIARPSDLAVDEYPPVDAPMVGSIRELLASPYLIPAGHLVRIQGKLIKYPDGRALIHDGWVAMEIGLDPATDLESGTFIEAQGYPVFRAYRVSLRQASVRRAEPPARKDPGEPPIRTAAEVRRLSREEAAKSHPVEIEAVLTHYDHHLNFCYVRDGTSPIFAGGRVQEGTLKPGDRVRIVGLTGPGNFAPIIAQAWVTVIGPGNPPQTPAGLARAGGRRTGNVAVGGSGRGRPPHVDGRGRAHHVRPGDQLRNRSGAVSLANWPMS